MTICKDDDGTKLSEPLTNAILEYLGFDPNVENAGGFVQVVLTRPDGSTVLAVDGRAVSNRIQEQPKGTILKVNNFTTILSSGSCIITVVRNGKQESWVFPDSFCPPH